MSEEIKEFFKTHTDFVTKVTSDPSLDLEALNESFKEIENKSDIKTPRLLTAALGLGSTTSSTAASSDPPPQATKNKLKTIKSISHFDFIRVTFTPCPTS